MTINFIHTLEAISVFLMFFMLFQVRKHYLLFSAPKRKTTSKPKSMTHKRAALQPDLRTNNQSRPASKYYFHKLPELEVTVSSDQDIASFTNTPPIKNILIPNTTAAKNSVKSSTIKKKKAKQAPTSPLAHKTILNNYIDDFFSEPAPVEMQHPDIIPLLDLQIDSPANDEIITVNEPTEMV